MKIPLYTTLTVAALAGGVAAHATGTLYFSTDGNPNGLYTLSTTTGAATLVGASGVTSATVGLSEGPNNQLLLGSRPFGFTHINTDGSGAIGVGPDTYEGLAYDPTSGKAYGSWINGTGFFEIDPATGAPTATLPVPGFAGAAPVDVEGLAYVSGFIYGLAGFGGPRGDLWKYDISGNAWSFVGNTGVPFNEAGLAYDPAAGLLYGIGSQSDVLYSIDPSNAQANRIGITGIGAHGGGLAFVQSQGVPDAGSTAALALGGCLSLFLARRRTA